VKKEKKYKINIKIMLCIILILILYFFLFSPYPEFKNILITNLKDNIAYIFNGIKFVAMNKNKVIDNLITSHINEIEKKADVYKNKITSFKYNRLLDFINSLNDEDTKFTHEDYNKTFTNYKAFKLELVKLFIYNHTDPKIFDKLKTLELNNKILTN
jgi:hypothetical protein